MSDGISFHDVETDVCARCCQTDSLIIMYPVSFLPNGFRNIYGRTLYSLLEVRKFVILFPFVSRFSFFKKMLSISITC